MGYAADHGSHGGEAFALHQLLSSFFPVSDVANGNDDAGELGIGIEELAGGGAHGAGAAVAMAGPIFGGA